MWSACTLTQILMIMILLSFFWCFCEILIFVLFVCFSLYNKFWCDFPNRLQCYPLCFHVPICASLIPCSCVGCIVKCFVSLENFLHIIHKKFKHVFVSVQDLEACQNLLKTIVNDEIFHVNLFVLKITLNALCYELLFLWI